MLSSQRCAMTETAIVVVQWREPHADLGLMHFVHTSTCGQGHHRCACVKCKYVLAPADLNGRDVVKLLGR